MFIYKSETSQDSISFLLFQSPLQYDYLFINNKYIHNIWFLIFNISKYTYICVVSSSFCILILIWLFFLYFPIPSPMKPVTSALQLCNQHCSMVLDGLLVSPSLPGNINKQLTYKNNVEYHSTDEYRWRFCIQIRNNCCKNIIM